VLDHPQFSAPSLLLLPQSSSLPTMLHLSPTHHETRKHVSPHKTDSRVEPPKFPGFKFKPRQANYSSQIKPRTTWFLILTLYDENIFQKCIVTLVATSKFMMNLFVTKFLPHHLPCGLPCHHIYDECFHHKGSPHQRPHHQWCYFAMSSTTWKGTIV
jgi:hypothetical protein